MMFWSNMEGLRFLSMVLRGAYRVFTVVFRWHVRMIRLIVLVSVSSREGRRTIGFQCRVKRVHRILSKVNIQKAGSEIAVFFLYR